MTNVGPLRAMRLRMSARRVAVSVTATAVTSMLFVPTSAADATPHLKSEIDTARSEAGCPAFQADPVLQGVSQGLAQQLADYIGHNSLYLPTSGETDLVSTGSGGLAAVLRKAGYNTNKVRLLTGYGDAGIGGPGNNEDKAVKAAVLEGVALEALSDCGFTKYGASALNRDSPDGWPSTPPRKFAVGIVVLMGA